MAIHIFLCLILVLKKCDIMGTEVSLVVFTLHCCSYYGNSIYVCLEGMILGHSVFVLFSVLKNPMIATLYCGQVSLERSQASGWLWDNDYPQLYQVRIGAKRLV